MIRMAMLALLLAVAPACNRSSPADTSATPANPSTAATVDAGALGAGGNPTVVLRTSLGNIKLRLAAEKAPRTVDNFFAQVEAGFYDQTIFHQVEPGYCIVAGGYGPGPVERKARYTIANEAAGGLSNRRGTVAMARAPDATDSATGQFFINVADNPHLDHRGNSVQDCGYCVFGEVIEGMDVVDRIAESPTHSLGNFPQLPVNTVMLEAATKTR